MGGLSPSCPAVPKPIPTHSTSPYSVGRVPACGPGSPAEERDLRSRAGRVVYKCKPARNSARAMLDWGAGSGRGVSQRPPLLPPSSSLQGGDVQTEWTGAPPALATSPPAAHRLGSEPWGGKSCEERTQERGGTTGCGVPAVNFSLQPSGTRKPWHVVFLNLTPSPHWTKS